MLACSFRNEKTTDKRGNSWATRLPASRTSTMAAPPSARFALQTTAVAAESGPYLEPASHPAHGKSLLLSDRRGKLTPPYRCLSLGHPSHGIRRRIASFWCERRGSQCSETRGKHFRTPIAAGQYRPVADRVNSGLSPTPNAKVEKRNSRKELQKGVAAPFQKPFAEDAKIDRAVFALARRKPVRTEFGVGFHRQRPAVFIDALSNVSQRNLPWKHPPSTSRPPSCGIIWPRSEPFWLGSAPA